MAQNDNTQRWAMFTIIGFNVTIILCMIIYSFARGGMSGLHIMDFVVTVVLASLVAAGVYIASMKLNL